MGKEYFLQGHALFFRLKEEEQVAEVLVVRSIPDPRQDPSLSQGESTSPGGEKIRAQKAEVGKGLLRPQLLGLGEYPSIGKSIEALDPLQVFPSFIRTKGVALEVDGSGDEEVLWAEDLDLHAVQLFGNAPSEYVLYGDSEA